MGEPSTFLATVIGVIASIVTGIVTWWITRTRERLDETRRFQRDLLTQLVANRHNLQGEPFTQALNGCAVVFAESDEVRRALRAFHSEVTSTTRNDQLIELALLALIRSMIGYLGLKMGDLPDQFLLKPFNTRAPT